MRSEIANKQKDAELKQTLISTTASAASINIDGANSLVDSLPMMRAANNGSNNGSTYGSNNSLPVENSNEIARISSQMQEQDDKWRATCDKIHKENEVYHVVMPYTHYTTLYHTIPHYTTL